MNTATRSGQDDGIGMIEIVVAMFIIAVLALSFLPVLMQGLTSTEKNAQYATASQIASAQMELARTSARGSCAAVTSFLGYTDKLVDGISYRETRTRVGSCPSTDLNATGTATIRVTVTQTGKTAVLATSETRVFVGNAP